jgi:PAS domain S-box-containing protein
VRYGVAVATVGLALLIKLLLDYLIDIRTPFLLFYVAVMASTLIGGLGPGLAAVALSTLATDYFFVVPNSLLIQSGEQNLGLAIFILEGTAISILSVRLVSARQRVERSLEDARQSEELRRSVIEQAVEIIFLVDIETRRILEANAALFRSLGYATEDLRDMTLYDIVAHDQESVDHDIERVLENRHYRIGERSYRRKDGSLVDVEVSVSAISYGGKNVVCVVAHDVTERKRAEEALREARETERRRMARDLHDGALQDLAYVLAEAQMVKALSQEPELTARIERKIEVLRRVMRELRNTVYDLHQKEAREVSLFRSVEALAELNRQMDPERTISIEAAEDFPEEMQEEVSRELLRVVQEALTNARRHSGAKNIRVRLRVREEGVVVEVADDGRGFGPSVTSGVGLMSMRERTLAIGGELEVDSEPGEGTIVRLRIPESALRRGTPEAPRWLT